jgi:hypothetical protein
MTVQNVMNNMAAGYNPYFFFLSLITAAAGNFTLGIGMNRSTCLQSRLSLCNDVGCATSRNTVSWHLFKESSVYCCHVAHLPQLKISDFSGETFKGF